MKGDYCNWNQSGRGDHPINCVSWNQARTFATWLGARLPTEAEWEYAARSGGENREYPWGDEEATCERAVVYERYQNPKDGNRGCGRDSTWAVCSKSAGNTEQGLCDMAGNVWEWVEDDWHFSFDGAPSTAARGSLLLGA